MPGSIGNVGGITNVVPIAMVVEAAQYVTGELIGGKLTITNALGSSPGSGILQSIIFNSKADLTVDLEVVIFGADPTNTTFTENGAIAIATTDAHKVLGVVPISTRKDLGTPVSAQALNIGLPVCQLGTNVTRHLYGAVVLRGTFTPAAVGDCQLIFGFDLDA